MWVQLFSDNILSEDETLFVSGNRDNYSKTNIIVQVYEMREYVNNL